MAIFIAQMTKKWPIEAFQKKITVEVSVNSITRIQYQKQCENSCSHEKVAREIFLITRAAIITLIFPSTLAFAQVTFSKDEATESPIGSFSCADVFQGEEYQLLDDDQLLRLHIGDLGERLVGRKCSEQTIRQYYQARGWKFVNSGTRSHVSGGPTGDADYYVLLKLPHYFFFAGLTGGAPMQDTI